MADRCYQAVHEVARRGVPLPTTGNMTAKQAARNPSHRLAVDHKLAHAVHRNGARGPVRTWAEAATLTKSAVAYNTGILNRFREADVTVVEVFGGLDCGWTSHQDPDKAAWTPRTVEEAREQHPYDVPEWITLPATGGSEAYLSWVVEETATD